MIEDELARLNALLTFKVNVLEGPFQTAAFPETPSARFAAPSKNRPPIHPACAPPSIREFNDRIFGAVISRSPPLPPKPPPATEIEEPATSENEPPDCMVTVPAALTTALSPTA